MKAFEEFAIADETQIDLLSVFPAISIAENVAIANTGWTTYAVRVGILETITWANILPILSRVSILSLPFIVAGDTNPWEYFTFVAPQFWGGTTTTWNIPRHLTTEEDIKIKKALLASATLYALNSGDDTRVYQIKIRRSDYYDCSHCLGGRTYLDADNTYKYGVSFDRLGTSRYDDGEGYVNEQILKGNMRREDILTVKRTMALAIEKMLIIAYMVHPENLARGRNDWLIRPAGNKIYR